MAAQQGIPQQVIGQLQPQLEERAVSQFVDTTLLLAEAARREITMSDQEIDDAISTISSNLPPGMTLEQAAAAQGFSMEDVRKDIREGESLRKLYDQETKSVAQVSDETVQAFYTNNTERFSVPEQASARHILIACDADASEEQQAEAKTKAEDLRKQLVDGADFAELAGAHSTCPSGKRGGDLGTFGRGKMVPEFEEAAFSQEVDAIGPVIKTPFGYHIVQVTDRTEAKTLSFDESREKITKYLNDQERNKHFSEFVKGLRSEAEITKSE
jgi:peptidyl-prolyl cis-trans isomerase C